MRQLFYCNEVGRDGITRIIDLSRLVDELVTLSSSLPKADRLFIRSLLAEGATVTSVAERMGRSRHRVWRRASALIHRMRSRLFRQARRHLRRLSRQQRQVARLWIYAGRGAPTIAAGLGRSPWWVRSRMAAIIRTFRELDARGRQERSAHRPLAGLEAAIGFAAIDSPWRPGYRHEIGPDPGELNMAEQKQDNPAPLRVGLVGVGGFARQTISLLPECPGVRVVAVADIDRDAAEQVAARFKARLFVDVRSMIVESPIDAVLMSLPHHEYPEYVKLAAQRGLHLLKEKPLARSLAEGLELVEPFRRSGKVFMLGTQRRFHPGFAMLKSQMPQAGRPFLVRSHFLFNWNGDFGWRGEKSKAGFGNFGDAGYHNIDLMNWLLGPPLEVYARQSAGGRENPHHPYETDDTGLCMMQYPDGLMGYLASSWVTQPSVLDVVIHGTHGTLIATPERFQRIDLGGKVVDEHAVEPAEMARQTVLGKIDAFVSAVRGGRKDYPCSAVENVLNQAVVEAAYLSSRTGQPQLLARIFELHGRSIDEFLPRRARTASGRPA